ncbi:hypothetical protein BH09MYX1_BH09MYX1_10030 [soil metagenome]
MTTRKVRANASDVTIPAMLATDCGGSGAALKSEFGFGASANRRRGPLLGTVYSSAALIQILSLFAAVSCGGEVASPSADASTDAVAERAPRSQCDGVSARECGKNAKGCQWMSPDNCRNDYPDAVRITNANCVLITSCTSDADCLPDETCRDVMFSSCGFGCLYDSEYECRRARQICVYPNFP